MTEVFVNLFLSFTFLVAAFAVEDEVTHLPTMSQNNSLTWPGKEVPVLLWLLKFLSCGWPVVREFKGD